jgi:hypothetical protein
MRIRVLRWLIALFGLFYMCQAQEDMVAASFEFQGEGESAVFWPGVKLFTDRAFVMKGCPDALAGKKFFRNSISQSDAWTVTEPGVLTVLTPLPLTTTGSSRARDLEKAGFAEVAEVEAFQLFGESPYDRISLWQKHVVPGESFQFRKWVIVVGVGRVETPGEFSRTEGRGELLYNGIRLPEEWPPRNIRPICGAPMSTPYLECPPEVILIDMGRQLFVDDFLIESTGLVRTFYAPKKYEGNPVLEPETELELCRTRVAPFEQGRPGNAAAVPKSGGIWWDADAQHFKLWYEAGWLNTICLATSQDGIHWERPDLDVRPGTNQVLPEDITPDSWTVVRNWDASSSDEKWTLFVRPPCANQRGICLTSSDGIHWKNRMDSTVVWNDRSTHFYNPFRKKWVFSIRTAFAGGRARKYFESDEFLMGNGWGQPDQEVIWLGADQTDGSDDLTGERAQLYNFDAVAYESIMLGQFQLHWGPKNVDCEKAGLPKITELQFAYSRDGFHFDRPDRRAHISAERNEAWDRGYVQSVGTVCTVMGDELWFYYSGFRGNPDKKGVGWVQNGMYDEGATGLAKLRRDGFASMDASGRTALLTTRPVQFSGKNLFVNLDAPRGSLRVCVLDSAGSVIEPYSFGNCVPLSADSTSVEVRWNGASDLSSQAGKPVRFQFELTRGSLYSFWVSRDRTGRSDGYVAGGGPGYTGAVDTVGMGAL